MDRRIATLIVSMIVVAGSACQRTPITAPETSSAHGGRHSSHAPADASAVVNGELAELRQLVAHYHDLDDAMAAGYSVAVTPCLALPGVGGMGFHYGNPTLINDPAVREFEPELLLYEPQKNGEMRFVGVEYIIPFALRPPTATPPILFGQPMHQIPEAGLWGFHAWVGRENPLGIFEDWNPKVTCEFVS